MKALRPILNLKNRRRFPAAQFEHLTPDRASRQRGSGAGAPPAHLPRRGGGRRPAHLQIVGAAPVHPVPPRGGEALSADQPAKGWRPHHGATAGPAPQTGPAARTSRMGAFDCDACGSPIGRGHAADCPNLRPSRTLTDWFELTLCEIAFGAGAALALWLRAPEIAALAVALMAVTWVAYRPPAPTGMSGTRRRGLPPALPASGAGSPGERNARMARTPLLGPPGDPTP